MQKNNTLDFDRPMLRMGSIAFLDNMVAMGQVEYSPAEGINRFAEWEWKGGTIPFENLIPQP